MKPLRVFLAVVGVLVAIVAIGLVAGGGALLWANGQRDADGYFSSDPETLTSPSYALVSEPLALTIGPSDWVPTNIATLRVRADDPDALFIGIAATRDVRRYLADVPYTRITDIESDPFRAISVEVPGTAEPSNPRGEDFWVATANDGTLTWDVRGGRWSIVAMNGDASQGVTATLTVGVETGILMPIGIALIVVGLVLAFGAVVLIVSSLRRKEPRHHAPGETPTRPDVSPPPTW
jgi:hypothetical protein